MRKLLLVLLGMFTTPLAVANDELPPVMGMFFNGMERHEIAMISTAATRCGALNMVVGGILVRDTSETDASDSYTELGTGLVTMGIHSNAALMTLRGVELDMASLQKRALNSLDMFTKIYLERMEKNQARTGEMFGGDELIKSDLEFCKTLTILMSDEWVETLKTNNWDYWDEIFQ